MTLHPLALTLASLFSLSLSSAVPATAPAPSQSGAPAQAAAAGSQQVIPIWPEGVPGGIKSGGKEVLAKDGILSNVHVPTLTLYPAPAGQASGAAVVVCPGGAYEVLSMDDEGHEVARWLNSIGVSAYVLKYRLKEYGQPAPLRDVLRAIRLVRSNAAKWSIDPARIGVMGFSAGGHLASTAATLFDAPEGKTGAALDVTSARPDFAVLIYPVITMALPTTHAVSRERLLGKTPPPELVTRFSSERQVTPRTPPTFIVHGADDTVVPVENSLLFYAGLRKAAVPAELHIYAHAPHGIGIRPGYGPASDWPARCAEWLRARKIIGS
jgi:acetyl esterase/lipase